MTALLAFFFAVSARADTPVPYLPRQFNTDQSMGAINENLRDITGRNRDNLVPVVADNACPAGYALTGATQKQGYIFGGTCSSVSQSVNFSSAPVSAPSVTRLNMTAGSGCDSTLPLTTGGALPVVIEINATMVGQNGGISAVGVQMDGAYFDGQSDSIGIVASVSAGGSYPANLSTPHTLGSIPSAGVHTFCLSFFVPAGGTGVVPSNSNGSSIASWTVYELFGGAQGPAGAAGASGSTVTVTAPITGTGSSASPLALDNTVVTEQGNTFNGAGQLLQLNGSAQITQAMIPASSIDTSRLAPGAVNTTKILNGAVTTNQLGTASVDTTKLSPGSVDTTKLVNGSVGTNQLASSSVDTTKLQPGSVDTGKLLNGSVDTTKVSNWAIDTGKLQTDSVVTRVISNLSVTTAKIADSSVDTGKLATDSVTAIKISAGAVDTNKVGMWAIDTTKIQTDAVVTRSIISGAVDTGKIANGSINTSKVITWLALDGLSTNKIAWSDGTVSTTAAAGGSSSSSPAAVGRSTTSAQTLINYATFGTCVSGSTKTVPGILATSSMLLLANASIADNGATTGKGGWLVDGAYPNNYSSTVPMCSFGGVLNATYGFHCSYVLEPLSAGSHTFCFWVAAPTSSFFFFSGGYSPSAFFELEIK